MFSDMTIMIPTRGRVSEQVTLNILPPSLKRNVVLLVDYEEFDDYSFEYDGICQVECVPKGISGIAAVRQYGIEICKTSFLFLLDDDMMFYKRQPNSISLKYSTDEEVEEMFGILIDTMGFDEFTMVGLSARQGNNHNTDDYADVTRQMNFHGVNIKKFKEHGLRFDGSEVMEDFNLLLDMFTQGIPNRVFYKYCWGQKSSGADGGCSLYRTPELQRKCALALKDKYPDFVTVVEKTSKSGWKGLETRTDVRMQWKKAFKYGLEQ